jgi:cytochrome c553
MLTRTIFIAALSALMLAAGAAQADGDVERGRELSIDCADCHGEDGKGDEYTVGIAGLDAANHFELLKKYQSGELTDEDEMMLIYTEELSDQDMKDLAAYYATLPKE